MENHAEGNLSSYERLKQQQTLGEILETAMSFEKTAYEFYASLQDKVSKRLRPLIQELVEEEQEHYELFSKLRERDDVQAHIQDKIQTPPSNHKFSDYVHLPKLSDFPDDQSILQYAMGREQAAMEQYGSLAEESLPGPIQDLFYFLSHEELEHKNWLEKKYYDLVHLSHEDN